MKGHTQSDSRRDMLGLSEGTHYNPRRTSMEGDMLRWRAPQLSHKVLSVSITSIEGDVFKLRQYTNGVESA